MLTAGDVEFEPATPKLYNPSNSTVVMIAGEASIHHEILKRVFRWAADKIKEAKEWIVIGDLAREYYRVYQSIKSDYAESRVLRPLGLTMDTFLQRQKQMAIPVVKEMTSAIVNFDMPQFEAIVSGIDELGAHIYVVSNSGIRCDDTIGFAAIGIGYWHANSQFMFAGHNRMRPLPETLLLTYAAKKRAEVAPGVGESTDMFTMGPALGSFSNVSTDVIDAVHQIYLGTRTRSEQSIKMANVEVNKYVEQLGRAASVQGQETLAPTADKPDGKENIGGEDSTKTGKPN
jgi:hypothetical protein